MTESAYLEVMKDLRKRLDKMDDIEKQCGQEPLSEKDWTWPERTTELAHRVHLLEGWAHGGKEAEMEILLDTIGAHLVAFKVALIAARAPLEEAA